MSTFADSLHQGQLGESIIANWLRRMGWHVLPAYEKQIDSGKGPRLFLAKGHADRQLIAPDILGLREGKFMWFEAKHKTRFSWYGMGRYFVTGIDKRHFDDYCKVAKETKLPVWVLFLHVDSNTWQKDVDNWNAPPQCPTGLFGAEITKMQAEKSHDSNRHGASGMYYWQPYVHLKELAKLEVVMGQRRAA